MMMALRSQQGMAMPAALAVMFILLLLTGGTVSYALRSVDRSTVDRQTARSLAAADAGLEVAGYRMNKTVTADRVDGLLPTVTGLVRTLGCLDATAAGIVHLGTGQWCALGSWEQVEGLGAGPGSRFTYYTNIYLSAAGGSGQGLQTLLAGTREVVAIGESSGQLTRVKGRFELEVLPDSGGVLTFERKGFVQCPSPPASFNPQNPAAYVNPAAGCSQ